ncbi:uncharacterized protein DS421_17g580520 [Arachis hypogaea]|nr:uncharacterized protein DS421_17g580520 [Arachis hypogaea]
MAKESSYVSMVFIVQEKAWVIRSEGCFITRTVPQPHSLSLSKKPQAPARQRRTLALSSSTITGLKPSAAPQPHSREETSSPSAEPQHLPAPSSSTIHGTIADSLDGTLIDSILTDNTQPPQHRFRRRGQHPQHRLLHTVSLPVSSIVFAHSSCQVRYGASESCIQFLFNFDISLSKNMSDTREAAGAVVALSNESASIRSPTALPAAPAPRRNTRKLANRDQEKRPLKLIPMKVRKSLVDLGLGYGITLLKMKLVIHSTLKLNAIVVGLVMLVIHIKIAPII